MLQKIQWPLIVIGVSSFIWWSFFTRTDKVLDSYHEQDLLDDVGKIYSDLGDAARTRGDFSKAINKKQVLIQMTLIMLL